MLRDQFFQHRYFIGLQFAFICQMCDERNEASVAHFGDLFEERIGRYFRFDNGLVQGRILTTSGKHTFIDHPVEPRLNRGVSDWSGIILMHIGQRGRSEFPKEVEQFHFPFAERNERYVLFLFRHR